MSQPHNLRYVPQSIGGMGREKLAHVVTQLAGDSLEEFARWRDEKLSSGEGDKTGTDIHGWQEWRDYVSTMRGFDVSVERFGGHTKGVVGASLVDAPTSSRL